MKNNFSPTDLILPQNNYRDYQRQRQMTIGDLLLENRIIFLPEVINGAVANQLVMQLLFLQSENRRQEIHFYINCYGGAIDAGMAIYDTMQILSCPVATYCVGIAASMGALLLLGGAKGKRYILPHARVMLHQPLIPNGFYGQASDVEIYAEQLLSQREMVNEIIVHHTGQEMNKIVKDTDRDFWLSAQDSVKYGIVDEVLTKPPASEEEEDEDDK